MKKIFFLVFVFLSLRGFAQYPVNQTLGSDSTLITSKGALKSRLINWVFTDTAEANLQRIKQYPAAQIITSSDNKFWYRNATATAWLQVGLPYGTPGLSVGGWDSIISFTKNATRDSIILLLKDGRRMAVKDSIGTSGGGGGGDGVDDSCALCYEAATAINDSTLRLYRQNGDSTQIDFELVTAAASPDSAIWKNNGTYTGNRTLSMAGYTQNFNGGKISIAPGTLADQTNALTITSTLPATTASFNSAVNIQTTTQTNTQNTFGLNSELLAGATNNNTFVAGRFVNTVAGTGNTSFSNTSLAYANIGGFGDAEGVTATGHNIGVFGRAVFGVMNAGVFGKATFNKVSASNVGVIGIGLNDTTSAVEVGVYAGLGVSTPTFSSSALLVNNGTRTSNIATFQDNGTNIAELKDGGQLKLNNYTGTNFYGTLAHRLGVDASGNVIQDTVTTSGGSISLTTTGTSGVATLVGSTLNIPNYTSGGWGLTGNSITAGTNFLGTTNNTSLRFKTNNTERGQIDSLGNLIFTGAAVIGQNRLNVSNQYSTQYPEDGTHPFILDVISSDSTQARGLAITAYNAGGGASFLRYKAARGTAASPAGVQANDVVGGSASHVYLNDIAKFSGSVVGHHYVVKNNPTSSSIITEQGFFTHNGAAGRRWNLYLTADGTARFYDSTTLTWNPVSTGTLTVSGAATLPTIQGGSTTTSTLILKPTTGVGTTGADIIFAGANNGATEFGRFLNSGNFGVGQNNPAFRLDILHSSNATTGIRTQNLTVGTAAQAFIDAASDAGAVLLQAFSSGFTTSGTNLASGGKIATSAGLTAGLAVNTGATAPLMLGSNSTEALRIHGTTQHVLIGTTTDAASSLVTMNSTTLGFLPPRMTTTQKNAIATPAEGLTVYDLTLHKLYVYDGTTWQAAW